jgi:hypothetical protein
MTVVDDTPAEPGTGDLLTVSMGYVRDHLGELAAEVRSGCVVRVVDARDRSVVGYLSASPPPSVAVTDAGDRHHFLREPRVRIGDIDGMTAAELAVLTGRTPAAIRQARHRARTRASRNGGST